MEELEHALKNYNMGDQKTIREIIAEVDTDNVCFFLLYSIVFFQIRFLCLSFFLGSNRVGHWRITYAYT